MAPSKRAPVAIIATVVVVALALGGAFMFKGSGGVLGCEYGLTVQDAEGWKGAEPVTFSGVVVGEVKTVAVEGSTPTLRFSVKGDIAEKLASNAKIKAKTPGFFGGDSYEVEIKDTGTGTSVDCGFVFPESTLLGDAKRAVDGAIEDAKKKTAEGLEAAKKAIEETGAPATDSP